MENLIIEVIYLIYFLFLIGSLIGFYIYSKKKFKEKINFKEVWGLFLIMVLLRAVDVISTIYFTNKIGIEYEGNLIAKTFMTEFGIIPGITIVYISSIPLMLSWFIIVNYIFRNKKIGWKIFKTAIIVIGIIIPIINFSV